MGRSLWLLCLLGACYSPTVADGLGCSESMMCPAGQTCDLATLTCLVTLPPTAQLASISTGVRHTCGLDPGNELWCWGDNSFGELGVGDANPRLTPAHVMLVQNGWNMVSAGWDGTCGIGYAGDLYCWGDKDTVGTQSNVPLQITDPPKWLSVSVGRDGFCAVSSENQTWCSWNGSTLARADLADPANPVHATRVAASRQHQCVLDDDTHKLYCWGHNDRGQVRPDAAYTVDAPLEISGEWDWVATGPRNTCALDLQSHLWCWGHCESYQTGTPPGADTKCAPTQIGTAAYIKVMVGDDSACAVDSSRRMVCFGLDDAGQLGRSTIEPWSEPAPIDSAIDFSSVGVGANFACATTSHADTYCWGSNGYGQLGTDEVAFVQTPAQVGAAKTWLSVSAGLNTTCAVATDHTLYCWGNNGAGQLADGTFTPRSVDPLQIGTDTNWYSVSVGSSHICALKGDPAQGSTVWCWGSNGVAQLGRNPADAVERAPVQVGTDADWSEVQAGTQMTCGIRTSTGNEGVYCWGDGLELPTSRENATPGYKNLAASANVDIAPQEMYVINNFGLYTVDALTRTTPDTHFMDGANGLTLFSIARGDDHHCGIDNGRLWCWGKNSLGQLGVSSTGPTDDRATSVQEQAGFTDWTSVDAGGDSTCAIRASGNRLYCWGSARTLGTPIQTEGTGVPTPLQDTWSSVSVGSHHVCAIKTDGTLWCWGENALGELGSGAAGSSQPMRVKPGT